MSNLCLVFRRFECASEIGKLCVAHFGGHLKYGALEARCGPGDVASKEVWRCAAKRVDVEV